MPSPRAVVALMAGAAILPFLLFFSDFRLLFPFHDDWDMLDGASRLGLIPWALEPFLGESVIPISKALWLVAVQATGGSYTGLIAVLFATHALNVWLFGELLRRIAFPTAAIVFALATFGLSWSNIETLGWAMQLTPVVALTFFLAALLWRSATLSAVSGLCSSRGIVSGALVALYGRLSGLPVRKLLPPLLVTVVLVGVMKVVFGVRQVPPFSDSLVYAGGYWLLNPLYLLLPIPAKAPDGGSLAICGLLKAAVLLLAWRLFPVQRPLLATLLCFDLLNAVSLGLARAPSGFATCVSSRYQYIALLCFGPSAGLLLTRLPRPVPVVALAVWIGLITWPWRRHAPRWGYDRGFAVRRAYAEAAPGARVEPSWITVERARELVAQYHLH